jgi:hypothetical protein
MGWSEKMRQARPGMASAEISVNAQFYLAIMTQDNKEYPWPRAMS